jgi:hypothetical protein
MWKLVIPALAAALTGCGGGGGSLAGPTASTPSSAVYLIGRSKNEIGSSTVFNSTVADLNGDGLDDIVVSGWAVAPSNYTATRSGFVNLKVLIQQEDGSLRDQTDDLLGSENSVIWGSQRTIVMDFDNDGRLDIAVMGFQDGPSAVPAPSVVFWNNGRSFSRLDLPEQVVAHAACAGDLNNDGLPELITGGSLSSPLNTIYQNQGHRRLLTTPNFTQQSVSAAGACAVIRDSTSGNVAIITTNIPLYPYYSAFTKIWDSNFNFVRTDALPGSEEPGLNVDILHDIVNVIPIDINRDGKTDLIVTDNGNWKNPGHGYLSVLINQGDFVFRNETARYLPNQSQTTFFNYYYRTLTVDGHPAIYLDHGNLGVSLWQVKNDSLVKYKDTLLNSLASGYRYTNIYKTKNGLSMFLIDVSQHPVAAFLYRPIPN